MFRFFVLLALFGCAISKSFTGNKEDFLKELTATQNTILHSTNELAKIELAASGGKKADSEVQAEIVAFARKAQATYRRYNFDTPAGQATYTEADVPRMVEMFRAVIADYTALSLEALGYLEENQPALTISMQKMIIFVATYEQH